MNETERQLQRDRKRIAVKIARRELRRCEPLLANTDERLLSYLTEVTKKPTRHNLYEILGAAIFMRKVQNYTLDWEAAARFIRFYQVLPFDGTVGVTSYRMTPVQVFVIANLFGLKTANAQGKMVRLHRDAYLFVPRKFAKTTLASAIAVWFMLFEAFNSQSFVIANSYDQAKVCFDMQRRIMQSLDPDGKMFRVNRERIFFENGDRASYSRCLAANPKNLDGLFAELVIRDEGAQARDTQTKSGAELKNVLTSSEGPREQPLNIDISTASEVTDGPFVHELDGLKEIMHEVVDGVKQKRGTVTSNDHAFGLLFQPDVDDEPDDPNTWAKVQPHLGITVQPDYYEKEWQRALLSAENMLTFRTKLLNIFTRNEQEVWISAEVAKRAKIQFDPMKFDLSNFRDVEIKMSADLSVKGDFSCVCTTAYIGDIRQMWMHCKYFVPDGIRVWQTSEEEAQRNGWRIYRRYDNGIVLCDEQAPDGKIHSEHENRHLYQRWVDDGHLTLVHGETMDYEAVADYTWEVICHLNGLVSGLGYDDYRSTDYINRLAARQGTKAGFTPYPQVYSAFTGPCAFFSNGIYRGHIFIDDNPINAYCVGNACLDYDATETNCKPDKIDPKRRIDGLVCMLMCAGQFEQTGHRQRKSNFE